MNKNLFLILCITIPMQAMEQKKDCFENFKTVLAHIFSCGTYVPVAESTVQQEKYVPVSESLAVSKRYKRLSVNIRLCEEEVGNITLSDGSCVTESGEESPCC